MQKGIYIFLILSILCRCRQKDSMAGIVSIPESGWPADKKLEYHFHHQESNKALDLLYQLQFDPEFPNENIWLQYQLTGPSGDTLFQSSDNLFLFEPGSGKPLGKGCQERLFIDAFFLKGIRLKDTGTYQLYVRHLMRTDTLNGIQALGIRVKKAE
jgi:gliding motility-associated lipoprotein GldH